MQRFALRFWLAILVSLLISTQALSAVLSSQVDRNRIGINETVTLTVTYGAQIDSSALDLQALSADFDVISNSPQSSSSVSIINGNTETVATTAWSIVLVPKRQGKLVIPAFTLANDVSNSITIGVSSSVNGAGTDKPLTARISAKSNTTYPGQQLLVEIELSANTAVRDLNGQQIILDGAEIEVLDQRSFQRNENGVIRQVIMLTYALFANEAGTVTIPALTFNGIEGGGRSVFNRGPRGKRALAITEPMEITVKPAEQKSGTAWFTASNLVISSQWSRDKTKAKVGEPLTRTIRIIASGQRASAIPPLKASNNSNDYKAYIDQPQLDNEKSIEGYTGTRTESEAIVPSRSGTIRLPEQRINWWNTKAQRWEEAILPVETLEVEANSVVASDFNTAPTQTDTADGVAQASAKYQQSLNFWKLTTLFLALVTVIQFVMLFKLNKTTPQIEKRTTNKPSDVASWRELQSSVVSGDANAIRKAIVAWASIAMPNQTVTSLHTLSNMSNAATLKPHLQQLDEQLYKGGAEVNLLELRKALDEFKETLAHDKHNADSNSNELAPLYPQ